MFANCVGFFFVTYFVLFSAENSKLNFSFRDSVAVFAEVIVIKSSAEKLLNVSFEKFL